MARFSKVIRLLSEELTDTPVRQIDALFEANDVPLGPLQPSEGDPGVRRGQMRRYLASLDLANSAIDRRKLAGVLTDLVQDIVRRQAVSPAENSTYAQRWLQTLAAAGFQVDSSTYVVTDPTANVPTGLGPEALAALSSHSAVQDHLERLSGTAESDPRLAVSTAKALIESTAKIVLSARGLSYTTADKVPALVGRAQDALGLAPKGVSEEEPALRRVLQSLVTLTQGVTEIRNQVGVDHGSESVPAWVRPRHARLVVGAAQVWCQLMLETLDDPSAPWRSREGH